MSNFSRSIIAIATVLALVLALSFFPYVPAYVPSNDLVELTVGHQATTGPDYYVIAGERQLRRIASTRSDGVRVDTDGVEWVGGTNPEPMNNYTFPLYSEYRVVGRIAGVSNDWNVFNFHVLYYRPVGMLPASWLLPQPCEGYFFEIELVTALLAITLVVMLCVKAVLLLTKRRHKQ